MYNNYATFAHNQHFIKDVMLMQLKILENTMVQVLVPLEMQGQAPAILQKIWREEFTGQPYFFLEMTDTVKAFVEEAKFNRFILVYR